MMPVWLVVLLAVLTTHRVTRLITRDNMPLIAMPREAFVHRWGAYEDAPNKSVAIGGKPTNVVARSLAYLLECDWCASVWVGAGVAWGTYAWVDVWTWQVLLLLGAASSVTGLIAQREPS